MRAVCQRWIPETCRSERALSSGGERFLDAEEVRGSNPLAPTERTAGILTRSRVVIEISPLPRTCQRSRESRPPSGRAVGSRACSATATGEATTGPIHRLPDDVARCAAAGLRVLGEIGGEGRHRRVPSRPEQIHVEPPFSRLGDQGSNTLPREVQADADGEVRLVARTRLRHLDKRG